MFSSDFSLSFSSLFFDFLVNSQLPILTNSNFNSASHQFHQIKFLPSSSCLFFPFLCCCFPLLHSPSSVFVFCLFLFVSQILSISRNLILLFCPPEHSTLVCLSFVDLSKDATLQPNLSLFLDSSEVEMCWVSLMLLRGQSNISFESTTSYDQTS